MKEIWINLELYFKRYDFYIFYGFFWIFPDFIFYLKRFEINKKSAKSAWVPRGCDVARKATWTLAALTWRIIFILFIITYIHKMGLQPSLDGKGINPLNCLVL